VSLRKRATWEGQYVGVSHMNICGNEEQIQEFMDREQNRY